MADWDDVTRAATALPEVTEEGYWGQTAWKVKGKAFAWERPLRRSDLVALGDSAPPEGPIVAVSVDGLAEKEAILAAHPDVCFTIPHFDGYAAVLVLLDRADALVVSELVVDAWLARAPRRLARDFLEQQRSDAGSENSH